MGQPQDHNLLQQQQQAQQAAGGQQAQQQLAQAQQSQQAAQVAQGQQGVTVTVGAPIVTSQPHLQPQQQPTLDASGTQKVSFPFSSCLYLLVFPNVP